MIDPGVASEAKSILSTVVSSGTGRLAQTGDPTWGKTGTTDDNGDAWFCGATPKITACVWVGFPNSVTPMETEYGGSPVDGGTFPALIFSGVVDAYDSIIASRDAGDHVKASADEVDSAVTEAPTTTTDSSGSSRSSDSTDSSSSDASGAAPEAPSDTDTDHGTAPAAPAGGGGGGGGSTGGAAAGSAGGVSPG